MNKPPTPETVGPLAMRRLTSREYNNTVADLLGDLTGPARDFPVDGPGEGGFESTAHISDLHVQYYDEAATTLVATALTANKLTIPCTNPANAAAETTCATTFIQQFGRRTFRRPVTPEEQTGLLTVFTTARGLAFTFRESIGYIVRTMLQSPGFLFHWEVGPTKLIANAGAVALTSYQLASRLSYFLWESMPDDVLQAEADNNRLTTPEQIETQTRRLLASTRAKNVMENFHVQWLFITNLDDLQKNKTLYPLFTDSVRSSLGPELTAFTTYVLAGAGDGTLKSLLTAPFAFTNAALAPVYGVSTPGTALVRTDLNPQQRGGILTQAAFLATRASPGESNPIYRGVAIYKQLLCGHVDSPPANVPPVTPAAPNASTRERYAAHANGFCKDCHVKFDNLGFAFENYDGIGAYRSTDAGKPVDAMGTALTPGGATLTFSNGIELSSALADSDEVKWCTTRQWFRYMLGRMDAATEQGSMELAYRKALDTTGFSIREMIVTAARSMAFRYRSLPAGEKI